MSRVLAVDYGKKRVGFAISDSMCMIANPLETVLVQDVWKFIDQQIAKHEISTIVVGYATHKDGQESESMQYIHPFVKGLKRKYPNLEIAFEDERYTSVIASQSLIESGTSKKTRQNKALIDTVSATLILQSYLERISSGT
ncbi:MAG: Holliday junction resolvase RuvX [Bacteroidales bacterium]|nr:Holliday junction resolvase RuvX [Bacteroidales bacterium]